MGGFLQGKITGCATQQDRPMGIGMTSPITKGSVVRLLVSVSASASALALEASRPVIPLRVLQGPRSEVPSDVGTDGPARVTEGRLPRRYPASFHASKRPGTLNPEDLSPFPLPVSPSLPPSRLGTTASCTHVPPLLPSPLRALGRLGAQK